MQIYLYDTDLTNPRAERFVDEQAFIAYTIAAAQKAAQKGDEVSNMESWGFQEIVDKITYDSYGDIDEYDSHYEADLNTCLRYWNVNKRVKVYGVADGQERKLWYDKAEYHKK